MQHKRLNQYLLVETLGQATETQTYKAIDETTGQTVVIKRLQLGELNSWKRLELFQREARVLARLNHPHIPRLLNFFKEETETDLNAYLVNEWIEGVPLARKIENHWMPDEASVLQLARQILWTLSYLHQFNPPVVHRDIKPTNLILTPQGKIFLIDFGGAQEILQPTGGGGSTVIGTFGYMAPEQFSGRSVPATDLYGLGTSLVHLLSGRSPAHMPQKNMQMMFQGMVSGSGGLLRWLTRLTQPDLEKRYKSAETALSQLYKLTDLAYVSPPEAGKTKTESAILQAFFSEEATKESPFPPHLLNKQETVNGYCIEEIVAYGSHTVSYFARSLTTKRSVFLKGIHLRHTESWKGLELFEREINALQQLEHKGIPEFIESFETENQAFYLVTEKLAGQNLSQKIALGWRPVEREVVEIALQALDILAYMHKQVPPVIHRDLKPSNFMLSENRLYLVDFGAVQLNFSSQAAGNSTIIGTYGYMAPEVFLKKSVPATDLYSLGMTLIKLLSGYEPTDIPQKNLFFAFRPLLNCSEALKNWLETLIHPDIMQRHQSAAQARQKLVQEVVAAYEVKDLNLLLQKFPLLQGLPSLRDFQELSVLRVEIKPVEVKPLKRQIKPFEKPRKYTELQDLIAQLMANETTAHHWQFTPSQDSTLFSIPPMNLSEAQIHWLEQHAQREPEFQQAPRDSIDWVQVTRIIMFGLSLITTAIVFHLIYTHFPFWPYLPFSLTPCLVVSSYTGYLVADSFEKTSSTLHRPTLRAWSPSPVFQLDKLNRKGRLSYVEQNKKSYHLPQNEQLGNHIVPLWTEIDKVSLDDNNPRTLYLLTVFQNPFVEKRGKLSYWNYDKRTLFSFDTLEEAYLMETILNLFQPL